MQRPSHRIKSITPFRHLLFDIRNGLSLQQFQELKDHSRYKLPEWKWRNLPNGEVLQDRNELFTALEESGALAHNNLTFLRSLLEKLKRDDLVEMVDDLQKKNEVPRLQQLMPRYAMLRDNVIEGLRKYDYTELKKFCRNEMSQDDWEDLSYHSVDGTNTKTEEECLFVALEKTNNLGPDNLAFLIHGLEEIGRTDLAWKLKELEEKTSSFSVFDWKLLSMVFFGALLVIFTFYQVMFPGLTYLRTWWCCHGAIKPLHMVEFDITMDHQRLHIRGVQFERIVLEEKRYLNYERDPSLGMRYYLNLDRCGAGGVRDVRNDFFNLPQVRGAEVFAVNDNCTAVFFQRNNKWHRYTSATNIVCPPSAPKAKEEKKESSLLDLLLDDKTDLPLTDLHQRPTQSATLYDTITEALQDDEFLKKMGLSKTKVREALEARNFHTNRKENSHGSDKVTFLIDSLEKIGRKDLARKLKELEKTPINFSVLDWRLLLLGVVLAAAFYQVMFPGPTYFRTWCCCYGSIKPIRMVEFDFTTMDFQRPHVRGVEFEWAALKAKLHLNFEKHSSSDMHYYLNFDRHAAGGVRHVRNALFNLPQVRGAEVFAVNNDCTAVYYNDDNTWKQYRSARNIAFSHNAPRGETKHTPLLALLLDDKTEHQQE